MKIVLPLLVLLCAAPVLAVPLSVNVVDDKGKPVAGADVQLESFGKSPLGFVLANARSFLATTPMTGTSARAETFCMRGGSHFIAAVS